MQDSNTDNKVFNLGSGLNYSVNEIYTLISKKLNSNIKPIYKENIAGEAQENLSDNTNANIIGWKPEMNIEQGLETMIDYIKKEIQQKKIL
jgi:UDP-glucose 4-epimerase